MKTITYLFPITLLISLLLGIVGFNYIAYICLTLSTGLFFSLLFLDAFYRYNSITDNEEYYCKEEYTYERAS